MAKADFREEYWMDMPLKEDHDVIWPPQITNNPRAPAVLTVSLEDEEPRIPEAMRVKFPIRTKSVTSVSVPSQPTLLLPSSIRSKIVATNLEKIRTIYGIPKEYQLRVANKKERAD